MVVAGCHDSAKSFGKEDLMAIFGMALVSMSTFCEMIHAKCFLKIHHLTKVVFLSFFMALNFLLLAYCAYHPDREYLFWVSLIPAVNFGAILLLAQAIVIGFLKISQLRWNGRLNAIANCKLMFGWGVTFFNPGNNMEWLLKRSHFLRDGST